MPATRAGFLSSVRLLRGQVASFDRFPFNIPAIAGMDTLRMDQPVTFLIGENGSGKSTLLEAIAVAWGLNPEGGSRNFRFSTRASHSGLNEYLALTKTGRRVLDSYFLRAESFYNVATEIEALDRESGGRGLPIIASYGGRSLHEQSHGEAFFAVFLNRLHGQGFYVLDEPEAALSPSRQLSFLARLHELVEEGSQFIVATHSPILMAYPHAAIWLMADGAPRVVPFEETEHYMVTRDFLTRTESMLDILLNRSRNGI